MTTRKLVKIHRGSINCIGVILWKWIDVADKKRVSGEYHLQNSLNQKILPPRICTHSIILIKFHTDRLNKHGGVAFKRIGLTYGQRDMTQIVYTTATAAKRKWCRTKTHMNTNAHTWSQRPYPKMDQKFLRQSNLVSGIKLHVFRRHTSFIRCPSGVRTWSSSLFSLY
jgi:hypothetical protein